LLGRRNYLASVVSLATPQSKEGSRINLENNDDDNEEGGYGNDFETNRRYLSLSWWLLHKGCVDLIAKVREAVTDVFGALNPREEITLEKLGELTLEVRKRVEGATDQDRRSALPIPSAPLPPLLTNTLDRTRKWLPYLLPSPSDEAFVLRESGMTEPSTTTTTSLRRLIDETSDLIDSPHFTHVLTLLLDAAFSHLIDTKISQLAYKIPPVSSDAGRVQELIGGDTKAKVASSLAVFCRQAHAIGTGANNEYLQAIEGVRGLEAFAAVVYSSHFEFETADVKAAADGVAVEAVNVDRPETQEDEIFEELAEVEGNEEEMEVEVEVKKSEEESFPAIVPAETVEVGKEERFPAIVPAETVTEEKVEKIDEEKKVEKVDKEEKEFESAWGKALAKEDGKAH
jgi:peroxin-3